MPKSNDTNPTPNGAPRPAEGAHGASQRLRGAARILRERAGAATPGPWEATVDRQAHGKVDVAVWADSIGYYVAEAVGPLSDPRPEDARYIATVHPGIALLVADVLDAAAAGAEAAEGLNYQLPHGPELALADALLATKETP